MPTESIEYRLSITGGSEVERALNAVEESTRKNAVASEASTAALGRQATATDSTSTKIGQFGSTLGLTGQALGRFSPQLGAMTSAAGQATGVIQALSTTGMGPLGLAIGGAAAAIGILSPLIQSMTAEAREAARVFEEQLNRSLEDFISTAERARAAQHLLDTVSAGRGTSGQQAGLTERSLTQLQGAAVDVERALGQLDLAGREVNAALTQRLERTQAQGGDAGRQAGNALLAIQQLDRASRAYETSMRLEREASNRTIAESERTALESQADAENALANKRDRAQQEQNGHHARRMSDAREEIDVKLQLIALLEKQAAEEAAALNEQIAQRNLQAELDEKELERMRERAELLDLMKFKNDAVAGAQAQQAAEFQNATNIAAKGTAKLGGGSEKINKTLEMGIDTVGKFGSTAASAFGAAIAAGGDLSKGFVKAIDEQLASLAIQETVLGIAALGTAIGNTIFNPPLAGTKYAEAGFHFAAAAIAGGISAAIPNAPAGGAGAGGGTGARPERSEGSGGGGDQTIVINFGGPVVTAATEAELGRRIGHMVNSGNARLGRG